MMWIVALFIIVMAIASIYYLWPRNALTATELAAAAAVPFCPPGTKETCTTRQVACKNKRDTGCTETTCECVSINTPAMCPPGTQERCTTRQVPCKDKSMQECTETTCECT